MVERNRLTETSRSTVDRRRQVEGTDRQRQVEVDRRRQVEGTDIQRQVEVDRQD